MGREAIKRVKVKTELPSLTISEMKFKSEDDHNLFLVRLMEFLGTQLEEYECEFRGVISPARTS